MNRNCILFCSLIIILLVSCTNERRVDTLVVFHAGSLSMPMKAISDSFMLENPSVKVLLEAAGSVECARKITELNRRADILASADYKIIDELLIPEHADTNILFAGNEMAIVYTLNSRYANEIDGNNWYKILQRPEVNYGRSDPNADPCGYRTLLTMQLAESYYNSPNLMSTLLQKGSRFIRPKEVELLALLESGAVDYIFLYRSVAVQHRLPFLVLPDEINLSNKDFSCHYKQARVTIRGSAPGDSLIIYGEPMVYGVTIPKNAPNKELATKFLDFFLRRDKGLKIIEGMGMPIVLSKDNQ